jgi:hypothetical protein
MLLDVEVVGGFEVGVALLVTGVDGVDGDFGSHRRRAVLADHDSAGKRFELPTDLAHKQVAHGEGDR